MPSFLSKRFDADDLDNKKIRFNPHEITRIAGQVAQIGQILGYDADELDDIAVTTACAIIGAACTLANTGLNIYDHVKSDDETESLEFDAEDLDDKKINLDEIAKIAGQTQQIIQILKSYDDDFENGLGKKLRKLGRRISRNIRRELPKVTEIAGKVSQIGEALGYDAEDADNYFGGGKDIASSTRDTGRSSFGGKEIASSSKQTGSSSSHSSFGGKDVASSSKDTGRSFGHSSHGGKDIGSSAKDTGRSFHH